MKKIENCTACKNHLVIADPDPDDWFCDDDSAVVCKLNKNLKQNSKSKWVSDRQEFRLVTSACRPYNVKKESKTPNWCPINKKIERDERNKKG